MVHSLCHVPLVPVESWTLVEVALDSS